MSVIARLKNARQVIRDTGLDAIVVTNPTNRRYLTGFTAEDHAADESAGVVLLTAENATLIVSPTNLPWAAAEADAESITVKPHNGDMPGTIAERLTGIDATTVAVEDLTTPTAVWFALRASLGERVEMVRASDCIDQFRAIKTADELEHLREAARLTDTAFAIAVDRLRKGVTEREAADVVRDALREVGSEGEAFETIVSSGPNAAKPHHRPGARRLAAGEPIVIDMGARVSGYNGDLTRTVSLGKADEKLGRIYGVVLEAQLAGLDAIRAGVSAARVDQATREAFAAHGLEQHVVHSAGHGLGLRVHEAPSVRKTSEETLDAGHVITMEPGLYIEGWGGVRIEDVVIVRNTGHENITTAPKGLDSLEH
ncbi:MAG TPA: Xaa-Pro peptidase family protein [Thermomicrobiales bacterium]|nr:Xaa-Pro peptidase family protein [Thermomicrobiales bacterium]